MALSIVHAPPLVAASSAAGVASPAAGVAPSPLVVLSFAVGGACLGVCSGLVPGLHANALALGLAAVAESVPAPPLALGAAMVAAGVVHTCLDVVPGLALGVPDPAMAVAALPGHRLVLGGRGREALRLSALGSGLALALAVPLAVPVTFAAAAGYDLLVAHLPVVVGVVVLALLAADRSWRARAVGAASLAASGALGAVALDVETGGAAVGGPLTPLFAGLFGAPILVEAAAGDGVPPQDDAVIDAGRSTVGVAALAGTAGGAAVGYLPGVSAGVAASIALPATPGNAPDREYVVATSGANTATAVFALFALLALGTPRSGVLVAAERVGTPRSLGALLATTVLAGAIGVALVGPLGDRYLRLVGSFDPRRLSAGVIGGLVALSAALAGVVGVGLFVAATAIGLLPPRLGGRRVYLMGVLLVPLGLGV